MGIAFFTALVLILAAPVVHAASKEECRQACQAEIDGCLQACGDFGDMERFLKSCKRAVIARCRAEGVEVCQTGGAVPPTTTTIAPVPTTTTTLPPCGSTAPTCNGACAAGQVCTITDEGGKAGCVCQPGAAACGQSFPACDGTCPRDLACTVVASGGCVCRGFLGFPDTTTSTTTTSTSSTTTTTDATCFDGIRNQDETDTDCGGSTCVARCDRGDTCIVNDDCIGAFFCIGGVCQ
jgi:hypothetical protein